MQNRQLSSGFSSTIVLTEKESFADDDIFQDHVPNRQQSSEFSSTIVLTENKTLSEYDVMQY